MDEYLNLANAIIELACKDYIAEKRYRKEVENFFRSDWFKALTDMDGDTILKELKKKVEEKELKRELARERVMGVWLINQYSKVEGMLYGHYRRKKRLDRLKSRYARVELRIERLRKDIKECNIDLEDTLKAIDYSRDCIQSGSITSSIERELERATDKLLRETESTIKEKYHLKSKINNLEKLIEDVEVLLEDLLEEEKQIIELRYSEKQSDKAIGIMLNMSRTTAQRKRKRQLK